ncbi:MAG TPA: N-acetyl-alpha-D-glucosaminyl L-malate synthase BshA [Verrucomicrobia bacterium]|nr:N-acetyl-alpha-D-glucosaminyl L-malate synthase BshA [Verrucomicrobiota bacterium]HOP98548.1 N-acetyl-alpha-D-glucosaminyl L-malate synthase BshA [Verrucomicrobiota bacterium]HPU55589.1 N-acetyl-alpha-D-glucosaminyl L-malate synthase BshA [Verrucomicrobiota bacterium]
MNIGIACYPSVGGSGILATGLGEELAARGHEVHFISYERPFRLPLHAPRLHFHEVGVSDYGLFKYPDYTLPLSVRMAEVSRDFRLDVMHVHYAVPHATAAILARSMLPPEQQPRVVTTLHGTDTTLLGRDADYGPAIRHALNNSDAVTTVSHSLREKTQKLFSLERPIEVIHNFFSPRAPQRAAEEVRRELGVEGRLVVLHSSNLRPIKRVDLLLNTAARLRPADAFKLVILAGGSFEPFRADVRRLGLEGRVIVVERVRAIEDYLQIADLVLYTSDTESFCLSLLEAMYFAVPGVARHVGGIPEVVESGATGLLVDSDNPDDLARAVQELINDPAKRKAMGKAAQERARALFSADAIVPQYEALYRRVCGRGEG